MVLKCFYQFLVYLAYVQQTGMRKNTFSETTARRNVRRAPASAPPTAIADENDKSFSDDSDDEATNRPVGVNRSKSLNELYAEIERQRDVICVLTTRLNYVLSMFGIDEVTISCEQQSSKPMSAECVILILILL